MVNTILTDDEIWHEWNAQGSDEMNRVEAAAFARAIEAAVLAKLREQEPVAQPTAEMLATFKAAFDGGSIWAARVKHCLEELFRTHRLYAAPLPAVVQVPLPERETTAMHDAVMTVLYNGVTRGNTDALWQAYRRVLLAAAPEAPAQGDPLEKLTRIQEELGLYNAKPAQPSVPAPWREAMKVAREALVDVKYGLEGARIWGGMDWTYNPLHPFKYLPLRDKAAAALAQLDALEGGE